MKLSALLLLGVTASFVLAQDSAKPTTSNLSATSNLALMKPEAQIQAIRRDYGATYARKKMPEMMDLLRRHECVADHVRLEPVRSTSLFVPPFLPPSERGTFCRIAPDSPSGAVR